MSRVSVSSPKHVGEIHLPAACHSPVSEKASCSTSLTLNLFGTNRKIYIYIFIYMFVPAVISSSYCSSIVTPLRPAPLGKEQTAPIILLYNMWVFFFFFLSPACSKRSCVHTHFFFFPTRYMNVKIYVWTRCLTLSFFSTAWESRLNIYAASAVTLAQLLPPWQIFLPEGASHHTDSNPVMYNTWSHF